MSVNGVGGEEDDVDCIGESSWLIPLVVYTLREVFPDDGDVGLASMC